jgi:hypothetical protein
VLYEIRAAVDDRSCPDISTETKGFFKIFNLHAADFRAIQLRRLAGTVIICLVRALRKAVVN